MKAALGDKVKDVRVSKRLTESAVCLVNDSMLDRNLERMLSRQKDSGVSISAPVLEINQNHALIKALAKSSDVNDAAHLLLDQAFILEGEQVADPAGFARRLGEVMAKAFAVESKASSRLNAGTGGKRFRLHAGIDGCGEMLVDRPADTPSVYHVQDNRPVHKPSQRLLQRC